ncbi:MAG TPA: phosphopantetheine-binding protein [Bacteroidales bacterium]|nr:MAG: acyl carrier protein [Bacteroidetes bacterium ADurb.Bin217]HOS84436.1 phosphopantetheine-binding protein [Bacteroidales bacterium]HPM12414.1 phosphopantetheine-binding protein [Bacteroidales bacterium]
MSTTDLHETLKKQIVQYLNILDFTPEQITNDMPLFGPKGLGLDSIDSLELAVMLEREYNIKLTNPTEARKILVNVDSIAQYIEDCRLKD